MAIEASAEASAAQTDFTASQNTRIGRLTGSFGTDRVVLLEFRGVEGVNSLFEFNVTALATRRSEILFDDLLGRDMTIEILALDGGSRWFNGIVTEAENLGPVSETRSSDGEAFRFVLRPWYWALGLRRNSRVFHQKPVLDILDEVFRSYRGETGSFGSHADRTILAAQHETPEYVVQYGETDLDFTRRIMEEYGINFHFSMESKSHTLILTDDTDRLETIPGRKRPYRTTTGQHRSSEEHFSGISQRRSMRPGSVRLTDFDFKNPTQYMAAESTAPAAHEKGGLEIYEHPGRYVVTQQGRRFATRRLDALRSADGRLQASGDVLSLAAGMKVGLSEHSDDALNVTYVAVRCEHHYIAEGYRSGSGGARAETDSYAGQYLLHPADVPLAPDRVTPRARITGPLTGTVVGKGEIDCDEYGRILVRFPWEDAGSGTMRCRVSQSWAGARWGSVFIPRVGMEVIVGFLDGDPDCPLVTGAVFNRANMPPFDLPQEQTISGFKSNSTPGGSGYNQLTFEDSKGRERIDFHAQKDFNLKILNDQNREVGRDEGFRIDGQVTGKIGKDRKVRIDGAETLDVAKDITITAQTKITLKVGASSITLDGQSITLSAPMITLDAKMSLTTKSGMVADHSAGANMTIKGLMVLIN